MSGVQPTAKFIEPPPRVGHEIAVPAKVSRVAFTCDFTRYTLGRSSQVGNCEWLHHILTSCHSWKRADIEIDLVRPPSCDRELELALQHSRALTAYRKEPELAWAARYDLISGKGEFKPLFDRLTECDLIIGFELSPAIKRVLHAAGRPYLSFHVHPIRFLRDLCFGMTTNCVEFADLAQDLFLDRQAIDNASHRFRAALCRRGHPSIEVPDDLPVLIAQTERDSLLIEKKRFAEWKDHRDRLGTLLDPYDGLVILEHPVGPRRGALARWIRATYGKSVIVTDSNGYGVFFRRPRYPMAVTLASSLGVEAGLIGTPVEFLLGDPRERLITKGVDVGTTDALGHGVLTDAFWKRVLCRSDNRKPKVESDVRPIEPFGLGDDYLRSSLESWSYSALRNGFAGVRARKVVVPGPSLTRARKAQLVAGVLPTGCDIPEEDSAAESVAAERGVDLRIAAMAMDLGGSISLDATDPWSAITLERFHDAEPWGIWMNGPSGSATFLTTDRAVAERARIVVLMTFVVHADLVAECPLVTLRIDEGAKTFVPIRPGFGTTRTVQLRAVAKHPVCRFELGISHTFMFEGTSAAHDDREIGLALISMEARCEPMPHDGLEDPCEASVLIEESTACR